MYAVNLVDLITLKRDIPIAGLLFPGDVLGAVLKIGKRIDGFALELVCDDERVKAIVTVLDQMCCRVRIYEKCGGWRYAKS